MTRPHFSVREHAGLRAVPPTIRVQVEQDGTYTLVDHRLPLERHTDLAVAMGRAAELLGGPGEIYLQAWDGLIFDTRHTGDQPPEEVAADAADPVVEPTEARRILGAGWVTSMEQAREEERSEAFVEGIREAWHVLHALHPALKGILDVLRAASGH